MPVGCFRNCVGGNWWKFLGNMAVETGWVMSDYGKVV